MKFDSIKTASVGAIFFVLSFVLPLMANAYAFEKTYHRTHETPVKYIPTFNSLSLEDRREVNEYNIPTKKKDDLKEKIKSIWKLKDSEADWWIKNIDKASKTHNVDRYDIAYLIGVESDFKKFPKGNVNIGPMQVNRKVWEGKIEYNIRDPASNIMAGTKIFKEYLKTCKGNKDCAFKSYNVGPSAYKKGKQLKAQRAYITKINKVRKALNT